MRSVGIFAALAMVVLLGTAPQASAQSQYCLPLQMELAELDKSGGAQGNTGTLRRQLREARQAERNAGCRSFFSKNRSGKTCRSINAEIRRIERRLRSSRGGFFGRWSPEERRRERIRRELARAGCSTYVRSFRTVCVRTCDGYYFPLSNTSSRQRFAQDEQKCMSQYPPGEAMMFYHPYPNGDVSQAVSLNGDRYFDQNYAFLFRNQFIPYCAARLHEGLAALKERVIAAVPSLLDQQFTTAPSLLGQQFAAAANQRMATPSVPIPTKRPSWSGDPETLANRAGGLAPRPVLPPPAAVASDDTGVRTVADSYYFAEASPGPPATVPGYQPPELTDFRIPQRATILPAGR